MDQPDASAVSFSTVSSMNTLHSGNDNVEIFDPKISEWISQNNRSIFLSSVNSHLHTKGQKISGSFIEFELRLERNVEKSYDDATMFYSLVFVQNHHNEVVSVSQALDWCLGVLQLQHWASRSK